jgi:hypothetical protein
MAPTKRHAARFTTPEAPVFTEPANQGLIQWPTQEEIAGVSRQLARIAQRGARSEASGDFFVSGDLAYQMHEIIRVTAELHHRSQRLVKP